MTRYSIQSGLVEGRMFTETWASMEARRFTLRVCTDVSRRNELELLFVTPRARAYPGNG